MHHSLIPFDATSAESLSSHEHERVGICLRCEIKVGLDAWSVAILQDLSTHSFSVSRSPRWKVGARVWIRLTDLEPLIGTVRWVTDGCAGCSFDKPLSPYVFEHLVRRP